jgi:hypothetical protein
MERTSLQSCPLRQSSTLGLHQSVPSLYHRGMLCRTGLAWDLAFQCCAPRAAPSLVAAVRILLSHRRARLRLWRHQLVRPLLKRQKQHRRRRQLQRWSQLPPRNRPLLLAQGLGSSPTRDSRRPQGARPTRAPPASRLQASPSRLLRISSGRATPWQPNSAQWQLEPQPPVRDPGCRHLLRHQLARSGHSGKAPARAALCRQQQLKQQERP